MVVMAVALVKARVKELQRVWEYPGLIYFIYSLFVGFMTQNLDASVVFKTSDNIRELKIQTFSGRRRRRLRAVSLFS